MPDVLRAMGFAAAVVLFPIGAQAVTWNIDFGSVTTTFEAPATGGAVTGLAVTLGGVDFDTPDPASPPFFDPATNDFSSEGGGIFSYYLGGVGCAQPVCVLEFENRVDDVTPPLWAAYPLVMGVPGPVFSNGHYEISQAGPSPVPLPGALAVALAGFGALGAVRLRRSVRSA